MLAGAIRRRWWFKEWWTKSRRSQKKIYILKNGNLLMYLTWASS